jgi:hypothetical protein
MSWKTRRVAAVLTLAAVAGCQSSPPLVNADGASTSPDGLANADQDPDVGACASPVPDSPCRVDSDCHNAYLVCARPDVTTLICRDPGPGPAAEPACPSPVDLTTIPICPTTEPIPFNVCNVRYERHCTVAADCGPAGFTCEAGSCRQQVVAPTCTTASDCPTDWDCYAPCPCLSSGSSEAKVCEPPFALFSCPACIVDRD